MLQQVQTTLLQATSRTLGNCPNHPPSMGCVQYPIIKFLDEQNYLITSYSDASKGYKIQSKYVFLGKRSPENRFEYQAYTLIQDIFIW